MKSILKNHNLFFSDLEVLLKLCTKDETSLFIFDPNDNLIWDGNGKQDDEEECEQKILVNFGGELIRFKEYDLTDFDYIIDFGNKINLPAYRLEKLQFIQSPNGRMRYIFDKKERSFKFLDFLPSVSLRARILKRMIKTVLWAKAYRVVGRSLTILSKNELTFKSSLNSLTYDHYAISLGTPGFWRKPIVQLVKNNLVSHYVKYGISPQTNSLLRRENNCLGRLGNMELRFLEVPVLKHSQDENSLIQVPQVNSDFKQVNTFGDVHFIALKELVIKTMKHEKLADTLFYEELLDQFYALRNCENSHYKNVEVLLNVLQSNLQPYTYTKTADIHGDFTPWNTACNDFKVYAYDWEMSVKGAPILYDLFHFVYQSEILVKRRGVEGVEMELNRIFSSQDVESFISRFKIDVNLNHQFYLGHVISKNLLLINKAETCSPDQQLLIENYRLALINLGFSHKGSAFRESFLTDFQKRLISIRYAALKFHLPQFVDLPIGSDLDLAIDRAELIAVEKFVADHNLVASVRTLTKSYMTILQIHFSDGSFLSIDLIHDFIRKGFRYLNSHKILINANVVTGIKRASLMDNLDYCQHFYTLNGASVPLNYQLLYTKKLKDEGLEYTYLDRISNEYQLSFENLTEAFNYSKTKHKSIKKFARKKTQKAGLNQLWRKINYLQDLLVELVNNRGYMVTFSGVDGAGKSTIIAEVQREFQQKYRKDVVLLRHRPGILPILSALKHGSVKKAEAHAGSTIPRQGKNNSNASSYLRFLYYFTDYFFGQVYVYFRYILRGKIVIYDRYYFDFINDSKRSNIRLNSGFVKKLYALIYKPKFNFYLYNEPAVILQRKQELSAMDIQYLNARYAHLFEELSTQKKGRYCKIKNDTKEQTVAQIFQTINATA